MPFMQVMTDRANEVFNHANMTKVSAGALAAGTTLRNAAIQLSIAQTAAEEVFLDSWPASLQEALIGALRSAMERTSRLPVTFSWAPAYDYEIQIWESHSIEGSDGAITILLRSPYP